MLLVTYAGKKWQDPCRMPLIMCVHKTKAKLKRNRMQYTPCLRKKVKIVFVITLSHFTNFNNFGTLMAKTTKLCKVHLFSTLPN